MAAAMTGMQAILQAKPKHDKLWHSASPFHRLSLSSSLQEPAPSACPEPPAPTAFFIFSPLLPPFVSALPADPDPDPDPDPEEKEEDCGTVSGRKV
jgi:hypothetical protein